MENQNNQVAGGVSPKELYDREKRDREAAKNTGNKNSEKKGGGFVWLIVVLLIIGGLGSLLYFSAKSRVEDLAAVSQITADDWIKGSDNPQAKVAIIEYSDFECPACASYYPLVKQLLATYGNDVRFAYRHFPLPQHKNAEPAAYAAEAAGKQGKFWEMHDLLFENQAIWEEQSVAEADTTFIGYATTLGLDLVKFNTDRGSNEIKDKVAAQATGGVTAGVGATPTFFLGGRKITPRNYQELESLVKDALDQ